MHTKYYFLTGCRFIFIIKTDDLKQMLHNNCFRIKRRMDMPPKPKFTKEEIISEALKLVSQNGIESLTARELGKAMGSSARPIFTLFNSMEELQEEVEKAAMRYFEEYDKCSFPDMPYFKQTGMKMVLFGINEPKLYQLLFMQETKAAADFADLFGRLGATAQRCIDSIEEMYGLDEAKARQLFENVWIYTFGIGALCATGMCRFSMEQLSQMLTTEFRAMMMMIKSEK